jgi:PTS system nitrogen regulatory IIA component
MRLNAYLRQDLLLPGLPAADSRGVLAQVGAHLAHLGYLPSAEEVALALAAREEVQATNLGSGLAVPHAILPCLPETLLLLVVTATPVTFGPPGSDLVDLFFVLLSPPGREGEHVKLLARICRLAREPGFLDGLRQAPDAAALARAVLDPDARLG